MRKNAENYCMRVLWLNEEQIEQAVNLYVSSVIIM